MSDVANMIKRAMTVDDLIGELKDMDPNSVVVFTCDYGDHCHTTQALPVRRVENLTCDDYLANSGYSLSRVSLESRWDKEGYERRTDIPDNDAVVILSSNGNS